MQSASVQDYLQMIYRLQRLESPVSTTALAARLHVSPASVTGMLRKLHRQGLAEHVPYQGVLLTERGEAEALRVLRRHRLWELFLTDVLGLSWDEVHAEAHRLEHATSERVADRLAVFLNEPQVDPHGQLIPDRNGEVPPRTAAPLAKVPAGRRVLVVEVPDGDPQRLRRLGDLGIFPGRILCTVESAGDLFSFDLDGQVHRLERTLADHILVREIDD